MSDPNLSKSELHACDKEPIHQLGRIQSHGYLFVLAGDDYAIKQVSENVNQLLDKELDEVLGKNFFDWIDSKSKKVLEECLQTITGTFSNPLRIPLLVADGLKIFDGVAHRITEHSLIVLEIENPKSDEFADQSIDRQIEHHFFLTAQTLSLMRDVKSLDIGAAIICEQVKSYTGFDRVMLYRFAEDFHGEVIGEAKEEHLEPFLGLHYPATDIPKQARELYKRNLVRLILDVNDPTVALSRTDKELDLSDSVLRAVSPIHIQYLKNMGVSSSMSISLVDGDRLWGLIACHHYSGPHYLSYAMRASCVHYGMVMTSQILSMLRHLHASKIANKRAKLVKIARDLANHRNFNKAVADSAKPIRQLLESDGLAVHIEDQIYTSGECPSVEYIEKIAYHFDRTEVSEKNRRLDYTHSVDQYIPELSPAPDSANGILVVNLSTDWSLIFFRKEFKHATKWAGVPHKDDSKPEEALTPRNSFAEWTETVAKQSRPWSTINLRIAEELRNSLTDFLVQQNYQLEKLNTELENKNNEVEQFAYTVSHDLKSPLVTVSGYVGALKEDLEEGDSESANQALLRIDSATKKMGNLIEELLTFSRLGRHKTQAQTVNLDELIHEIAEEFELRFARRNAQLKIHGKFGQVMGYRDDLWRVLQNLIENTLKYGEVDGRNLEVTVSAKTSPRFIKITVSDNGPGIDEAYRNKIFHLFHQINPKTEGSGVGLASVAKIINQHRGKFGCNESEHGGASFWFSLPTTKKLQQRTNKI